MMETLFEFFSNTEAISVAAGFILSPAKLVGIAYGIYRTFSLSHHDRTWDEFVESRDDMEP